MDDMNAFEHQVARDALRDAGPSRSVDAAAVFARAVPAAQPPAWSFGSMFSATKFVVAGAIVALFGGLLLAGVLPTGQDSERQPAAATSSATLGPAETVLATRATTPDVVTRADILPGVDLAVDELEPGVLRILNDGVRDLHAPLPRSGTRYHLNALTPEAMAVGQDGHPWLIRESRLLRLGEAGEQALEAPGWAPGWLNMAVDASGTFWGHQDPELSDVYGLESFDGSTWTRHDWPDASEPESLRIEAAPDGSVIVGSGDRVARIRNGEWSFLPSWEGVTRGQVYYSGPVATDDTVWLGCGRHIRTWEAGCEGLLRFDGSAWDVVAPVPARPDLYAGPLAVGPDGTLWAYLHDPDDTDDRFLARLRDDRWSVFSAEDGVPPLKSEWEYGSDLSVDADGTLWIATELRSWDDAMGPAPGPLSFPNGVLSFDGAIWRQYLADMNVQQVEAVDGHVWALDGADYRGDGLHVITPEAAAAADAVAVESSEPSEAADTVATPDLLPGVDLVTEEVEPGVYRVLGDGVRDLDRELDRESPDLQIVPGLDGGILLAGRGSVSPSTHDAFFRLGSPEVFWDRSPRFVEFDGETHASPFDPLGMAPAGTLWGLAWPGDLATWDGEQWMVVEEPGFMNLAPEGWGDDPYPGDDLRAVLGADGSVWVVAEPFGTPSGGSLFRISEDGFQPVGVVDWIAADAAGGLILVDDGDGFKRAAETGLEPYSDATSLDGSEPVGVASDGTLWWTTTVEGCPVSLARLDTEGWSTFDIPDGVVSGGRGRGLLGGCGAEVAPDGSIWIGHGAIEDMPPRGVHRFDGSTWTQYLPDLTVADLAIAPDGSIWLWAQPDFAGQEPDSTEVRGGLHVITPEAVAAAE